MERKRYYKDSFRGGFVRLDGHKISDFPRDPGDPAAPLSGGIDCTRSGGKMTGGGLSTVCMPGVGWLTGRLLSVPDEGPSGEGEDKKKEYILYILKYRSHGEHSEHALNMH